MRRRAEGGLSVRARTLRRVALGVGAIAATVVIAPARATPGAHPKRPTTRHTHISPADRAATYAYLAADETYQRALAKLEPAILAAQSQLAGTLERECPGVLARAPELRTELFAAGEPPSARARGELSRQERQLTELESELDLIFSSTGEKLAQPANEAFLAAVRSLHWSEQWIMVGVRNYLLLLEAGGLSTQDLNVCADMRTWAQSGYRTLASATRELQTHEESHFRALLHGFLRNGIIRPESPELLPFEGARARALAHRIVVLETGDFSSARFGIPLLQQLQRTLGIEQPPGASELPKRTTRLGKGTTAAGERFHVEVQSATGSHPDTCRHEVEVGVEPGGDNPGSDGILISSGGSSTCLDRHVTRNQPVVGCRAGTLTIEVFMPASIHAARLLLSDGRTITSHVFAIPKRLGGPLGFYYQALRGPTPIPVSLTELDAQGRATRTLSLPRLMECRRHPLQKLRAGRTVVHGQAQDDGPSFTLVVERERFLSHSSVRVHVSVSEESALGGTFSAVGFFGFSRLPRQPLFSPSEHGGCHPHPYEILYGLFAHPHDTVLAQTPAGLVPLTVVKLPRALHTRDVLLYGAFSPPPTALIVRNASGKTLETQPLISPQRNRQEECEGEAEPPLASG